ncbi:AarF/UbiB family protein, partial [Brevibacterium casei]|uniref:AarF/UbiB family protein n=1 Tax=Brevibacterium casei TaxID=33889 RepID=UPI0035CCFBC9
MGEIASGDEDVGSGVRCGAVVEPRLRHEVIIYSRSAGCLVRIQALYSCSNLVRSTSLRPSVVQIPNVYPELSGEHVIVMDLVEGVPLSHASEIVKDLSSIARGEIAQDLL